MSNACTFDLVGEMNDRIHRGHSGSRSLTLDMTIDSLDVEWLRKQYADSKLTKLVASHLRNRLGWKP